MNTQSQDQQQCVVMRVIYSFWCVQGLSLPDRVRPTLSVDQALTGPGCASRCGLVFLTLGVVIALTGLALGNLQRSPGLATHSA